MTDSEIANAIRELAMSVSQIDASDVAQSLNNLDLTFEKTQRSLHDIAVQLMVKNEIELVKLRIQYPKQNIPSLASLME